MSRRQLKKKVLAEALRIYREVGPLPASTVIQVPTGRVLRYRVKPPYQFLDDLLHLCAQLEGDLPCVN